MVTQTFKKKHDKMAKKISLQIEIIHVFQVGTDSSQEQAFGIYALSTSQLS